MVGDEFSRKPYAIAVQQGSPLKDQFNNAYVFSLTKRVLFQIHYAWTHIKRFFFLLSSNMRSILLLLNKRKLEKLKEKWWNLNPNRQQCEKQDNQSDGISIHNIGEFCYILSVSFSRLRRILVIGRKFGYFIGGVFIVIFVGIGLACITLAFEYWFYKYKQKPRMQMFTRKVSSQKGVLEKIHPTSLADFTNFKAKNNNSRLNEAY